MLLLVTEMDLGLSSRNKRNELLIYTSLASPLEPTILQHISSLCSRFLPHKGEPQVSPKVCQMYSNCFVCSLHEGHKIKANRAAHICLSVRPSALMIQLENHCTDQDEILYGCCAIGGYLTIVLLNMLRSVITK
jgi:hypothetical protein